MAFLSPHDSLSGWRVSILSSVISQLLCLDPKQCHIWALMATCINRKQSHIQAFEAPCLDVWRRPDVATWRRGDLSAIRSLLKSSILALAVPWNWLCLHGCSFATYHLVDSWSLICTFITQPPLPVPTCVWLYYWVWFMAYLVSFLNLILTELPCIFYQLSSFFSSDPLYQVNV